MRPFLVIFLLTQISFNSAGQIPKEFNYWFYNLPITTNPENVFDILSKDRRFITKRDIDSLDYSFLAGETYWGQILKVNLPDSLNKADSSSIILTWGILSNTGQKNASKTYSGNVKILRLEYFLSGSSTIEKLFNLSNKQLGRNFLKRYNISIGIEGTTDFETGNEIIYVDNRKHLQKLKILKKTYLDNKNSFCLEFHVDSN